ncbi:MAG: GGDEF domain-containing protein [Elusimicrobia bacterium]|nr:GGDEF domain-containing protein [Elusimicrobiota bacterium]
MNPLHPLLLGAFLASTPGISFWIAWPRRWWAALAVAAGSAAVWGSGFVLLTSAHQRQTWIGLGLWAIVGGLYTAYVIGRNGGEYDLIDEMLEEREAKRGALEKIVGEAKVRGAKTEAEQREVLALYGLVKGLSEALNWDEIRPKLEAAVQQFVGVDEFALYVSDLRSENSLHPLVTRRLGNSIGANWKAIERYLQANKIGMNVPHVMADPESAVMLPIREGQEVMGFFFAHVAPGGDPQALVQKALSFADQTGFAFRRLKLFQEVERLSQVDGLTGLARRGVLDQKMKEETVRAKTFKTSYCFMLLDIDHFKKFNDTYGHQFGDVVLKRVAEVVKASVYETDFVARYGGEEFGIVAPRADHVGVLRKAEAVRANVEKETFTLGMETIHVTVSLGIAHFPRDGSTPEEVIHQADNALYHAKETGRNRFVDIATVRK